jgi:hypothetical protein
MSVDDIDTTLDGALSLPLDDVVTIELDDEHFVFIVDCGVSRFN